MKNRWEKRDGYMVIFANGSGMQHEILVDEEDFEAVAAFPGTWYVHKGGNTFYARINVRGTNGKREIVQMHRLILDSPTELEVDHRNHNGLDNCRGNIRIVTHGENQRNRIDNAEFQSDVDGVSWDSRAQVWWANPRINGKHEHLGFFDTEIEAEATVCMFLVRDAC